MDLGPYQPNSYVVGEVRELLRALPDDSIDCVVTSPPYWGLRSYNLPPVLWGGQKRCRHRWGKSMKRHKGGPQGKTKGLCGRSISNERDACRDIDAGQFCQHCGAWRGSLGLEPTYPLYIQHMVEVFRQIRRVLKPMGTCWLNLGDCYATWAGSGIPGGGAQGEAWRGLRTDRLPNGRGDQPAQARKKTKRGEPPVGVMKTRATRDGSHAGKHTSMAGTGTMIQPNRMPQPGLKPKDMVGVPWRVAFALQDDGWWLRRDIIWHKPAPTPESATDRPTSSHEYLFLLTKSGWYEYDYEASREPCTGNAHPRGNGSSPKATQGALWSKSNERFGAACTEVVKMRNLRSVWTIAAEPLSEAHYAAFPTKLVQPCITAGCPVWGVVLDPFAGSGRVGRAAEDLGRNWLLFDLNPEYAEIAMLVTAQLGLLGGCGS